jgi:hypothetical protein
MHERPIPVVHRKLGAEVQTSNHSWHRGTITHGTVGHEVIGGTYHDMNILTGIAGDHCFDAIAELDAPKMRSCRRPVLQGAHAQGTDNAGGAYIVEGKGRPECH